MHHITNVVLSGEYWVKTYQMPPQWVQRALQSEPGGIKSWLSEFHSEGLWCGEMLPLDSILAEGRSLPLLLRLPCGSMRLDPVSLAADL